MGEVVVGGKRRVRREKRDFDSNSPILTQNGEMTKMPLSLKSHPTAEIRSNLEMNGPD